MSTLILVGYKKITLGLRTASDDRGEQKRKLGEDMKY